MTAILSIFAILLFLDPLPGTAMAETPGKEVNRILSAAENLFESFRGGDYVNAWRTLSRASRDAIVKDVRTAVGKTGGGQPPEEEVRLDFEMGGPLSKNYWNGYLLRFDPAAVLEESRWELKTLTKTAAEISIRHRKSDKPALLRMFLEDGSWKVGLTESFWQRTGL